MHAKIEIQTAEIPAIEREQIGAALFEMILAMRATPEGRAALEQKKAELRAAGKL